MTSCVKVLSVVMVTSLFPSWTIGSQIGSETKAKTSQIAPKIERSTMPQSELDITSIFPGDWRITLIETEVIPEELGITLKLEIGTAQFFAGCNTVNATHSFASNNGGFTVTNITRETCGSEIMIRETALLDAISKVEYLTTVAGSALGFYDWNNQLVLAATKAEP
jgi:hypothetical protein